MNNASYKDKVIKGTAWNLLGTFLMLIIGIGSSVLYVRYLGSQDYGIAVYITDMSIFAVTICSLGLGTYQSKVLQQLNFESRYSEYKFVLIHNIKSRFLMVMAAILLIIVAGEFASDTVILKNKSAVIFLVIFLVIQMLLAVLRGPLLVEYQQKFLNSLDVGLLLARLIIVLVVICFNYGLIGFLISEVIVEIGQLILLFYQFNRLVWPKIRDVQPQEYPGIFKTSLPMYLVDLSTKIYSKEYDVFLIGLLMGSQSFREITIYSLNYVLVARVFSFLGLGTSSSASLIMNFSSELIADNKAELLKRFIEKQFKMFVFLVLPIMFGGGIVGGNILQILYGKEFSDFSAINALFFVGYSISVSSFIAKPILFVLGKEQALLKIRLLLALVKTVLLLFAIYNFGIIGVAVASVLIMSTSSIIEVILLRECINFYFPKIYFIKILISCVVMSLCLLAILHSINTVDLVRLLLCISLSSIAYLCSIYFLKPLDYEDYETLNGFKMIQKLKLNKIILLFCSSIDQNQSAKR
ncbi:MAG TPA: hypothetical protein DEG92_02955 [Rikenellaceae bacterium]|nr:hypothetical protein [Rikenellaceae bacterium]